MSSRPVYISQLLNVLFARAGGIELFENDIPSFEGEEEGFYRWKLRLTPGKYGHQSIYLCIQVIYVQL